ncbi:MAG TPA: DMT family transporter [Gammaproteobacteria bacterium]|nr:DMT family transporter [Gammaproteobacteria bacterium]
MRQKKNSNMSIAYLFLILAPMMVGINIVGSKYLITSMPVLFLLAVRFLVAAVLLLPLHWLTPDGKQNALVYLKQLSKKDWCFLIAQALTAGVFFNVLMVMGLQYTDANIAGVITSALPAIIVIMSCIVLKDRFTIKKMVCVGFATVGLVVINAAHISGHTANYSMLGNLLVFLSLLPEASYYILTKLHPSRLPIFLMSSVINLINAVILLPILGYYLNWKLLNLPVFDWLILIVVGIASGLFYVFWYIGSAKVDAVMAALSTAFMPIATIAIAWLTLGEKIDIIQFIGVIMIIMSILAYALPFRMQWNHKKNHNL